MMSQLPSHASKRFLVPLSFVFAVSSAQAGEAFKCHVESSDHSVNEWIKSQPMSGHGMQHFAMKSFVVQGRSFEFDADSTVFSPTDVNIRISNSGFTAIGKNLLIFSAPNVPSLRIDCVNQ